MNLIFRALADPTRRKILQLLRQRDMNAGEIADNFPHAKPTLSRHFGVLREADLIQADKRGTTIIYRLNISVLEEALLGFMDAFKIVQGETGVGENSASENGESENGTGENNGDDSTNTAPDAAN